MEPLTLRIRNSLDAITPATEAAENWLAREHIPLEFAFFVELAIEETAANCIMHGYDDDREHIIDVIVSVDDRNLTVLVVDDGHAFDPLTAPAPDLSSTVEDRPIGGLGIHLLRQFADEIAYERRNGTNRLRLTKRLA